MRDLAACLASAIAGEGGAGPEFLRRISTIVWAACVRACGSELQAREAFEEAAAALSANGFARLRGYRGRGRVETYVAVVTRDLLAARILRLLFEDRRRGWAAFEHFFADDLRRRVRARLSGAAYEDLRADGYQELCIALIEDDYRRLRQYTGIGSFAGFVLRIADRILIDFARSIAPRRRLPAAVARLDTLEQAVFRLLAWRGVPDDVSSVREALGASIEPQPSDADVSAAIATVRVHVVAAGQPRAARGASVSLSSLDGDAADSLIGASETSPEDVLIDEARELASTTAAAALRQAAAALPDRERIYLEIVLGGGENLPPREIARLMQRPIAEIYKLKQRVHKCLHDAIAEDSAVKNWRASV